MEKFPIPAAQDAVLLKYPEACRRLGLCETTVKELCDEKILCRVKIGRAARVTAESVRKLAEFGTQKPAKQG